MKYMRTRFPPGHKGKKLSVTFRKNPKIKGLASVCAPEPSTIIKINKQPVGEIKPPSKYNKAKGWYIIFTALDPKIDEDANKIWKWIQIRFDFPNEPEARKYAKENILKIAQKHHLFINE